MTRELGINDRLNAECYAFYKYYGRRAPNIDFGTVAEASADIHERWAASPLKDLCADLLNAYINQLKRTMGLEPQNTNLSTKRKNTERLKGKGVR